MYKYQKYIKSVLCLALLSSALPALSAGAGITQNIPFTIRAGFVDVVTPCTVTQGLDSSLINIGQASELSIGSESAATTINLGLNCSYKTTANIRINSPASPLSNTAFKTGSNAIAVKMKVDGKNLAPNGEQKIDIREGDQSIPFDISMIRLAASGDKDRGNTFFELTGGIAIEYQ